MFDADPEMINSMEAMCFSVTGRYTDEDGHQYIYEDRRRAATPHSPAPSMVQGLQAATPTASSCEPSSYGFARWTPICTPETMAAMSAGVYEARAKTLKTLGGVKAEYTRCDPDTFAKGITYDVKCLYAAFPNLALVVDCAKIRFRAMCLTELGIPVKTETGPAIRDIIDELRTTSEMLGEPVELGLHCKKSKGVIPLDLYHSDIIKMINNDIQATIRKTRKFSKSVLEDYISAAGPVGAHRVQRIRELIGLGVGKTTAEDPVFAHDRATGAYYRDRTFLFMVASLLIKPMGDGGPPLLSLFPSQFNHLPDALICSLTAIVSLSPSYLAKDVHPPTR
ncbi:hypothetical protein BV22DRAFT_1135855 [Leucogyrophana mollusca]|uniref:Uncharacterized protein n=1 Tax=Leucogyrophana mollusca TaxID=85980 RepID=A0ACB8AWN2_9AGAM|nr:hypothetical protein BV22DRAFT_1135855 [Leucogyrophana mollusca]